MGSLGRCRAEKCFKIQIFFSKKLIFMKAEINVDFVIVSQLNRFSVT